MKAFQHKLSDLFLGSDQDNFKDMVQKQRGWWQQGGNV